MKRLTGLMELCNVLMRKCEMKNEFLIAELLVFIRTLGKNQIFMYFCGVDHLMI